MKHKLKLKQMVKFHEIVDEDFIRRLIDIIQCFGPSGNDISINIKIQTVKTYNIEVTYKSGTHRRVVMTIFYDGAVLVDVDGMTEPLPYQIELMDYYLQMGYYKIVSEESNFLI